MIENNETENNTSEGKKISGSFMYLLRNFAKKHRLSVRDQHTDTEIWYIYISSMRFTLAMLGVMLIMAVAVVLLVIYTPVLDTIPGYPGKKSREMLSQSIMRLDSLENELNIIQAYSDNVSLIMEGRTPVVSPPSMGRDSVGFDRTILPPSAADSLFRRQIESSERYGLVPGPVVTSAGQPRMVEFIPPLVGKVVIPFDPRTGMYGVGVDLEGPQQVVAVQAGTVVMSMWTPESGYVIQIQHKDNYISFYKRNTQSLKSVGDAVEAGEVIGSADSGGTVPGSLVDFVFELWYDGAPVDPQRYVFF